MPKVGVADARRAQVKRAALECLVKNGFGALSVKDIAAQAGVSTGVLYHYFRNKDDILIQSLAAAFAGSDRDLRETVGAQPRAVDRLRTYLRLAATIGRSDPATASVLLNGLGQMEYSEAIGGRLARLFAGFRTYAAETLQEAYEEAGIGLTPERRSALAGLIVAVGLGLLCQWAVQPGSIDTEACGRELEKLFAAIFVGKGTGNV